MLPVDLQDPPELLVTFVQKWREEGYKVVYGVRTQRDEGVILRTMRRGFYMMVNRFANIEIPENTAEFQLIDRQVLEALKKFNDHYPYIRGMIANCGFDAIGVPYTWKARRSGFSKNRFYNLIDQAFNGFFTFTNVPLRLSIFVGFILSTLSLVYGLIQLFINIFSPEPLSQPGIPTLIVALFFFSGVQLLFTGIMGEYINSIHSQVRHGSVVIEKERLGYKTPPASSEPSA